MAGEKSKSHLNPKHPPLLNTPVVVQPWKKTNHMEANIQFQVHMLANPCYSFICFLCNFPELKLKQAYLI